MMNDGIILGLVTGAIVGAVVTTMCSPARKVVQKGAEAVTEEVKHLKAQALKKM